MQHKKTTPLLARLPQNGDISSTWNKISHALQSLQPARDTGTATAPSVQAAATIQCKQQYIHPVETVKPSADSPEKS